MTTRHWTPGVLVAALLVLAPPAHAQAPSPIQQGLAAAWARQPEQRAAPLRREAAAANLAAADRWTPQAPSLEVSAKTDRFTRNHGVREYDAAMALPLWLPQERSRARAAASADLSALDARLAAAQWRLAADVRAAYWAQLRACLESDFARQRLASAELIAADVARRVKAGDLARADGHQAESAVAAAQGGLAEAAVGLAQTAQAWVALTGQQAVGNAGEPQPADADPGALHPALRELSARHELARRQRDLASVQTRANPELTLGAVRERGAFGERHGQSVVVGLRIPLGASSTSRARQAAAGADLVEIESQLALETERVRLEIDAARALVEALGKARAAAERRATLGRESRRFFEKSFRLGETDLPTRLGIELEAFEAERQAARSRLEVDAAISQLRQALGLLPE